MKRLSPWVVLMAVAAAALAIIRNVGDEPERPEEWKPVRPS